MDGGREAVELAHVVAAELLQRGRKVSRKDPVIADMLQRTAIELCCQLRHAETQLSGEDDLDRLNVVEQANGTAAKLECLLIIAADLGYSEQLKTDSLLTDTSEISAFLGRWREEVIHDLGGGLRALN